MTGIFITAIGTHVGKTYVTSAIAYQLRQAGKTMRTVKPIVSGYRPGDLSSDTAIIAQASGLELSDDTVQSISPWRFRSPLSPHQAAEQEEKTISFNELTGWCQAQLLQPGITVIEGVGGLMVPINKEKLVIDWIEALSVPVLLVSATYLGAINHTLLSVEALQRRNIPIRAVLISQSPPQRSIGLEKTWQTITGFCDTSIPVFALPRRQNTDNPFKGVPDLLSLIQ